MKTKAVYVVTSKSNDIYLEQLLISAYSLRLFNPDIIIELVTDNYTKQLIDSTRKDLTDIINNIITINIPSEYNQMEKSRYLKTSLRNLISGDYIFIDTDTVITTSLHDVDNFDFNVGAVLDRHSRISKHSGEQNIKRYAKLVEWEIPVDDKYFNSGIMYVKDSDLSHKLYIEWNKIWKHTLIKSGLSIDQPALAKANSIVGYPIVEMDGIYNCQIIENGLKYLYHAKIIHYYASNIGKWDCPYIFREKSLYNKIRNNGIDKEIETLIKNAKSAFNDRTLILGGNMCDAYQTTLSGLARRIFSNTPRINQLVDNLYKIFH